jgi:Spy/CpxP family protein refolding chaperone
MNKKLILATTLVAMMAFGANAAFSTPPQKPAAPAEIKNLRYDFTPEERAQMQKKKGDWANLTPEQKQEKKAEMKQKHGQKKENFYSELGLTEAQKEQAKANRMKSHEQMKPIMEQMQAKRAEMRKVRESDIPQAQKEVRMNALKAEMKPLKDRADEIRKANMAEFEKILTPEQKAKFQEMKKNKPEGRKGGPRGHGPKGGGPRK